MRNKEIWLLIASGGRWSSGEVKQRIQLSGREVDRALYAMSRGGLIVKFDGKEAKYGVTPDCITPRMTSISEILSAVNRA